MLPFERQCGFDVVLLDFACQHQLQTLHAGFERVAGAFEIRSDSHIGLGLGEPVLALYVVGLTLFGRECRRNE